MIDQIKKQYRRLVGMLLLKKATHYGLFILLAFESIFLFGFMVQGITFKGIVTITKNPFYPKTIQHAVTNGGFADVFSAITTIIIVFTVILMIGEGRHKELFKLARLVVNVLVPIGGLFYFGVNNDYGVSVIKTIGVWYLVPGLMGICIMQLTTVSIEKIKRQIIKECDLFSLEGITLEYQGLSEEWNKYLFIQQVVKTIDYDVQYPMIIDKGLQRATNVPHILGEVPRTVVTARVKNTFFELELCSSPELRYKERGTLEAEERV